jgi:hypothetical protein
MRYISFKMNIHIFTPTYDFLLQREIPFPSNFFKIAVNKHLTFVKQKGVQLTAMSSLKARICHSVAIYLNIV